MWIGKMTYKENRDALGWESDLQKKQGQMWEGSGLQRKKETKHDWGKWPPKETGTNVNRLHDLQRKQRRTSLGKWPPKETGTNVRGEWPTTQTRDNILLESDLRKNQEQKWVGNLVTYKGNRDKLGWESDLQKKTGPKVSGKCNDLQRKLKRQTWLGKWPPKETGTKMSRKWPSKKTETHLAGKGPPNETGTKVRGEWPTKQTRDNIWLESDLRKNQEQKWVENLVTYKGNRD